MANAIIRNIPNTITSCNLLCGCIATWWAFQNAYEYALLFIVLGAVFDFFDGMTARLLHVSSPIGKELDSLADDITFGLAPAATAFSLFKEVHYPEWLSGLSGVMPYTAFLIAVFSALRLAKFNIDDRQSTSFIGLPIPANALFWIGVCFADTRNWHPGIILGLILLFSFLMVSNLPMFSLKASNLSWSDNKLRYILVITARGLIIWLGPTGLAGAIIAYILLSLAALLGKR